jgi:hypothetical protein
MPTPRTCPNCGAEVEPPRVYCKLSCRIAYEHREMVRTPRLFRGELTMESEFPPASEIRPGRRSRRRP